jgi:dCMP deaminase
MEHKWKGGVAAKPDFDTYFMALCYLISQRSIDTSTCCGAVLVSKEGRILSTGYNGPVRGSIDMNVPMTRPDKYMFMIHSEENCLLSYSGSFQDLEGSTMYITGTPCSVCFRMMLQKGIKRFVYANVNPAVMMDEKQAWAKEEMAVGQDIQIIEYTDMDKVKALLGRTVDYIDYRLTRNQ